MYLLTTRQNKYFIKKRKQFCFASKNQIEKKTYENDFQKADGVCAYTYNQKLY